VGGALPEAEFVQFAADAGLVDGRITDRFDTYEGTTAMAKLSKDIFVRGVNFSAIRG
jgi:hypothetical protein